MTTTTETETETPEPARTRSGTSRRAGQTRCEFWMSDALYAELNEHLRSINMTRAEWGRLAALKTLADAGKLPS